MKKTIVFIVFLVFAQNIFAQDAQIVKIINGILQMKTFIDYRTFKKDLETIVSQTANDPNISYEDYMKLQQAYNATKKKHDEFIGVIKKDLIDIEALIEMTKKPEEYAKKYMNAYNESINFYEANFLPVYNEIQTKSRFALTPSLIVLGVKTFNLIVKLINERKLEKGTSVNRLLLIVNKRFVEPLALNEWNAIVTHVPPHDETSPDDNTTNDKDNKNESVNVPYPTMKNLEGSIEFIHRRGIGDLQTMKFSASRDLGIGTGNDEPNNCLVYETVNDYVGGTEFQIKIKNSGLMYIFSLNKDGSVFHIYPYSQELLSYFKIDITRDLGIGPAMNRNEDGITIIPSENKETGDKNYIYLKADGSKEEQICIILTKSELKADEISEKIQQKEGNFTAKINDIFGENLAKASEYATINNGVVSFNDPQSDKVMAIIFKIKR